ncbi:Uncharacterized protein HZ326_27772 [Fusarium oxysporum f. sp. albedinis]|nr:Uncharacterized protein HZ326_27772 [Fusarium oxysporum f. sp. albedinis]
MPRVSYTEDEVAEAMLDVTDNGLSQSKSAQKREIPRSTFGDRFRGLPSRSEVTQPAQLLSKPEESRLVAWILRQEALGYAPSHSQVRATVNALLRQQGREKPVGVHWLARFMKRHPSIKTKIGKRKEASRFNCFTPTAVNWYFDIREREYGWIKPENTVNVDEGGIMAGFGLDSLVVGSSDPRKKAFLKGSALNKTSLTKTRQAKSTAIRGCITCAIYKLEKYVTILEDSPAYWTAMILHPAFKDKWIREYLPGEHANRIVDSFKRFFERDYNKLPSRPRYRRSRSLRISERTATSPNAPLRPTETKLNSILKNLSTKTRRLRILSSGGGRERKAFHGLRGWRTISYLFLRRRASVRGPSASPSFWLARSDTPSKI